LEADSVKRDGETDDSLLLCHVGELNLALPIGAVLRILRMAALSPVPASAPGVSGMLNIGGEVLPVVDPRPALGIAPVPARPDQYLILVADHGRYALWVDDVDRIVDAPTRPAAPVRKASDAVSDRVAQIQGSVIPILDLAALDPSGAAVEAARQ